MQGQKVCKFFLNNNCKKGDACIFKHDEAEKGKNQQQKPFQRNQYQDQRQGRENQFQFNAFQQKRQQPPQSNFQKDKQNNFQNNNRQQQFNQNQQKYDDRNENNQQDGPSNEQGENRQSKPYFNNMRRNQDFDNQNSNTNRFQNSFQSRNQNFNPRDKQHSDNEQGNNNNFNRQQFRNNNTQFNRQGRELECEKKVFKRIQSFHVSEFVQAIYVEQFKVVGIAKRNQIIFFKLSEQIETNNKTCIQLPENTSLVFQMWNQVINNQLVLILSYQAKKIQLKNLAIYPSLWNSYFHLSIFDVSMQEIVYCKVSSNLCLSFCNDGYLRVYTLLNNAVLLPPRIYNFGNPIEIAITIPNFDNNEEIYLIGLRNGNLLTFNNEQMISIPHELNNQQFALVDLKYDSINNLIFLLFWQLESIQSQILMFDIVSGKIKSIHQLNMHIFQIECINDYIICSNDLGVLDILKKQQSDQYVPYSYYPNKIQQFKQYNKIISAIKIQFQNINQVNFDYLLIGRSSDHAEKQLNQQEEENIELIGFE